MQQTVLAQVTGSDQEEVQLTELLPVKQSRIRENIFKDTGATDALKALRSFSDGCAEDRDFGLRVFDFPEVAAKGVKGGKGAKKRRRAGSRRKTLDNGSEEKKGKKRKEDSDDDDDDNDDNDDSDDNDDNDDDNEEEEEETTKRRGRNTGGTLSRAKSRRKRRKPIDAGHNDENDDENDEDGATYLDLDNNKYLNDEIYVFRRESLDPNAEDRGATSDNDYSTTDGAIFDSNGGEINDTDEESDTARRPRSTAADDSEKELRLKIDAIIQANLLLEKENNNVPELANNKKVDGETDGKSVTSSVISKADSRAGSAIAASKSDEDTDKVDEVGSGKTSTRPSRASSKEDGQEKKYCCVVCDSRFKGSGGLRNHYKVVHGAGPVFKCDECGKEFPLKERLKLHVRTHTGFKPYKCPECEKSFARGGQLVQHRRTHSQIKPYRCAICSGTFTCAANLALHVKRHNGQKDHKCEICGRGFVRRDALKKHLECLHRDVKSFLCVICNKTFKGHLPQHMRTHARDRPHGCATCGQRFAQKSQLTVHQRTHSGQRPFRCLVCWQAFAHSTALKLHTRRHTGERPFKCLECNAGFTQLPHWKKHMKCIHGRNEPYSCKRCKSFFRIKNDLETHEKTCRAEAAAERSNDSLAADGETGSNEKGANGTKCRVMSVERMRLLLAVLLKRISKQERLDELGFGKRLIDEVLHDSLLSAGKDPASDKGLSELEVLAKNLEIFLEWTVPKEHWENFRRMKKTPEDILETLTAT